MNSEQPFDSNESSSPHSEDQLAHHFYELACLEDTEKFSSDFSGLSRKKREEMSIFLNSIRGIVPLNENIFHLIDNSLEH